MQNKKNILLYYIGWKSKSGKPDKYNKEINKYTMNGGGGVCVCVFMLILEQVDLF